MYHIHPVGRDTLPDHHDHLSEAELNAFAGMYCKLRSFLINTMDHFSNNAGEVNGDEKDRKKGQCE